MKRRFSASPIDWVPLVLLWSGAAVSAVWTPAFKTFDSESYQGTVSLLGNYTRGWPTVALYEIFPPDTLAIVAQFVVYAAAWSVLLLGWTLYKKTVLNFIFSLVLVTFALSPAMVGWNVTILSEPLTISLVVLGVGLLGLGVRHRSRQAFHQEVESSDKESREVHAEIRREYRWVLILYLASALCFSLAAVNRITVVPLVLIPTILLVAKLISDHGHRRILGATVGICGMLILYPVYFSSVSNSAWNEDFGVSRTTIYFFYGTSVTTFSPQFADHIYSGITDGGPSCLRQYRARFEGPGPFDVVEELVEECPQGAKWIDENFSRRYVKTLVSHPRVALNHLVRATPETAPGLGFSQSLYGSNRVATIIPAGIISLFDASLTAQVRSLPFILWGLVGVILTIVGLCVVQMRSERWWIGVGVFLGSGLGVVLTILALADELSRSAAPSTSGLILGAILLLHEGVEWLSSQRVGRREGESRP